MNDWAGRSLEREDREASPVTPHGPGSTERPAEPFKQLALGLEAPQDRRTASLRSYHVRSHVSVPEALEGERKAERQEDLVLAYFRIRPGIRLTPSEVHTSFPQWPLTSVRRAMTNLTVNGWLIHHKADRRPGPYGAQESVWSLA